MLWSLFISHLHLSLDILYNSLQEMPITFQVVPTSLGTPRYMEAFRIQIHHSDISKSVLDLSYPEPSRETNAKMLKTSPQHRAAYCKTGLIREICSNHHLHSAKIGWTSKSLSPTDFIQSTKQSIIMLSCGIQNKTLYGVGCSMLLLARHASMAHDAASVPMHSDASTTHTTLYPMVCHVARWCSTPLLACCTALPCNELP